MHSFVYVRCVGTGEAVEAGDVSCVGTGWAIEARRTSGAATEGGNVPNVTVAHVGEDDEEKWDEGGRCDVHLCRTTA